jgi:hypothetical protein
MSLFRERDCVEQSAWGWSRPLLLGLLVAHGLMKLGGESLTDVLTEGLFDELAGVPASLPGEIPGMSLRLHPILAVRGKLFG